MPTVEARLLNLENKISQIEKQLKNIVEERPKNQINFGSFEKKLSEKLDDIGTQDLVIVCLKLKQKQSKSQLEDTIKNWGKPSSSWFNSNNFKARLRDKGFIMKDGKNENDEDVFSLTQIKGVKMANQLFKKYELF